MWDALPQIMVSELKSTFMGIIVSTLLTADV
jgi:hypothetical protein